MAPQPTIAEFFSGIGGLSACLTPQARVRAIDINRNALEVYSLNFQHPASCQTIESLTAEQVRSWAADCWWLSAPCQPFTRRGRRLDAKDNRAAALLHLIDLLPRLRPAEIALENVPEFRGSQCHQRLCQALVDCAYQFREVVLCPTQLGHNNRRSRYFLIGSVNHLPEWSPPAAGRVQAWRLEHPADLKQLAVEPEVFARYRSAMHVVTPGESHEPTRCFTAAYGRSHVRSGSLVRVSDAPRRFSPREILWQLGFASDFKLPDWPFSKLWPLVGNSLSLPCVRYVLGHLPLFDTCLAKTNKTRNRVALR